MPECCLIEHQQYLLSHYKLANILVAVGASRLFNLDAVILSRQRVRLVARVF
jgi:hypothetical protein